MSYYNTDNAQWLSITEDSLFLHDGLIRVTDLVTLPYDVDTSTDADNEVVSFDTKNPAELCQRILAVCGKQNNVYATLLEYRLNALRGFWIAQRQTIFEQQDRETLGHEETIALLKKQGLWQQNEQTSFASRVSLLLVFPLLQSQSRTDPDLCGITAELLLQCLKECPPLSLVKEPVDCLNGLETLLCNWLGEDHQYESSKIKARDPIHRENATSALIALACARGSVKTFIHAVHLLQNLPELGSLPVADILYKLLELEGGIGCPPSLMGSKHILCWGIEDLISYTPEKDKSDKEGEFSRSISCDGKFLFTTNFAGQNLAKIGTGLHGTLRGYVYIRNMNLGPGLVASGNGILLFRLYDYDLENEGKLLAMQLNPYTLQPEGQIPLPSASVPDGIVTTIQFCSDGCYFYWFWIPGTITDKNAKSQSLYMDVFKIKVNPLEISAVQKRVILSRKDEVIGKNNLSENVLSRLGPYRSTAAAAVTLVALSGNTTGSTIGPENVTTTSCGLPLKSLLRSPIYTCGNFIVILTSLSSSGNNSSARFLFGNESGLTNLRALATNLCFQVSTGHFHSRNDLVDAPACALSRGVTLQGIGVCYDALNNMIWTCSNDWVDQFYNPGHHAMHHTCMRLEIEPVPYTLPSDNRLTSPDVIRLLMQHVGSMCCHHMTYDLLQTPLGTILLQQQQQGIDVPHLGHILDILEIGIHACDNQIIVSSLINLQVLMKMSIYNPENLEESKLIKRLSMLVWQLLTSFNSPAGFHESHYGSQKWFGVQAESCNLICAGLYILYPALQDRHNLLNRLFLEGTPGSPLSHLRDMILLQFSEQLQSYILTSEEAKQFRLTDELVHYLLKIVVKESCILLRKCTSSNSKDFYKLLVSLPNISPCLRYLSALQNSLLREAILYKKPDANGNHTEPISSKSLKELQCNVVSLALQIFNGAYEVVEAFLEVCNVLINQHPNDLEHYLRGLEKVAKFSILGHLLPVLITSLTHPNLQCLAMGKSLLSQLVQLVILTSQAALLLKSQVGAVRHSLSLEQNSSDQNILHPIGNCFTFESGEIDEKEEAGFLTGLRIPEPWATGRIVESIHPVRDNYKFKEVVQIPGARCLYLRFDPRCSSQYDYDKLTIYAGPNSNAKKIAEYGGNIYGYGSRSVLGTGWPKDLIRVEGDTATFVFEMRSGREHNTPDKALWGFLISIRAQEPIEDVSNGFPFLTDLALGLSVLACTMLQILYQGPLKSKEELECSSLLQSRLLQMTSWNFKIKEAPSPSLASSEMYEDSDVITYCREFQNPPNIINREVINKLRKLSQQSHLQIRPSIREIIHPELLEDNIVSCIVKHLQLVDLVHQLNSANEKQEAEDINLLVDIMQETFKRIDSIIRRLQALVELEQQWLNELKDIKQNQQTLQKQSPPFFHDFHLNEVKYKELSLLCYLKDIDLEKHTMEVAVKMLGEKLETEAALASESITVFPVMKKLVKCIISKTEFLLNITLSSDIYIPNKNMMTDGDRRNKVNPSDKPPYARSLSAPSELGGYQERVKMIDDKTHRTRFSYPYQFSKYILQEHSPHEYKDSIHFIILEQLFHFLISNPKEMICYSSFLEAAKIRYHRGTTRTQALIHMKELLTAAARVGGATHLMGAVTSVIQKGPRLDELVCGGMVQKVKEAFSETMTSVVQLAAHSPIACCNSVGLLCAIPYTRSEEKCLVRSGLVHLLDHLCSLSSYRGDSSNETQSIRQRVSAMAWAGFQVLSNRCVMWEDEDGTYTEETEQTGLAFQVATLLTNHLARATECSGNEAAGNEALQEVLNLLNNLSRSKMGKDILKQPACVSKLLALLLDQRPSPKLVLIILQLCRVALPLMSAEDCAKVELPAWGSDMDLDNQSCNYTDPPAKIASLLLAKLGDYVIPGCKTTVSRRGSQDLLSQGSSSGNLNGISSQGKDRRENSSGQNTRVSLYVHKRDDQLTQEFIQLLSNSSCNHLFHLGTGSNSERLLRIERELTKFGKAKMCTENSIYALRRAVKWAQTGLVISKDVPIEGSQSDSSTDKKKSSFEISCRERNSELAKTDPVRPFISGHVANSMASEVIALLHGLLTATTAQIWASSVEKVLADALSLLPEVIQQVELLGTTQVNIHYLMNIACRLNVAFCALGGFKETIKTGSEVLITGSGIHHSSGQVLSISEQQGIATVKLEIPDDGSSYPRACDVVTVPLSRLQTPRNLPLPVKQLSLTQQIAETLHTLLVSDNGKSPLQVPLPIQAENNVLTRAVCRVIAELRSRACMVLAKSLHDSSFICAFIHHSSRSIDTLKSLAKECSPSSRLASFETHCERLRMLYRDCAKPPLPPSKSNGRVKEIAWIASQSFPPLRSCVFTERMTSVIFVGDPNSGSGLPRGIFLYASHPIPQQAPSFYWEIEICSYGKVQDETGLYISFGFAPFAEKKDGAWTYPVGTVLFHNNGRAVHYNGSSLLQWKSVRLDVSLNVGDVAGCGWERVGNVPELPNQQGKGTVFFVHNGHRLNATLEDITGGIWPVVHLQRKNLTVRANFGTRPFTYPEGQRHYNAADESLDSTEEISANFGILPFHGGSDTESDNSELLGVTSDGREKKSNKGAPCKIAVSSKNLREYNSESSINYKLQPSFTNFIVSGPDIHVPLGTQDDESENEEGDEELQQEGHHLLLVKAWESKVFPVIRRRFRNEAERKDGLEQIRGALQLGMTDIARQTVEYLYEENGGIPRDLHLPTLENIKEEASKFTIERIRKGIAVVIRNSNNTATGTTLLPKFAVHSMLKTFGLTGVVLDIDAHQELVQVETYLKSEGVLVRFWYPVDTLERPPAGFRKTAVTGAQILDTNSIHIHRELLFYEHMVARLYCRQAFLQLMKECNSPSCKNEKNSALSLALLGNASYLQDLDVENLQLLSNELLAPASPSGNVLENSLDKCECPEELLTSHSSTASSIFYQKHSWLKNELNSAIVRSAKEGEDYLIELTTQICMCLQLAPETFPSEEFLITESKVTTDVHFPGASFLIVSCKTDPKASKKESSSFKSPWARIYCYSGLQIEKNGQMSLQEVTCYPRDATPVNNFSSVGEQYAPLLLPSDRVHLRLGGVTPPGMILTIHAIPPQLPLALAYLEELFIQKCKELPPCRNRIGSISNDVKPSKAPSTTSVTASNSTLITTPTLLHAVELIGNYMWRTDIPAILKERLFHVLAEILHTMHHAEIFNDDTLIFPSLGPLLSPSLALFLQLQSELRKLYEEETKTWSSSSTPSGIGIGLGVGNNGRFSSYFHALMEVSLAIAEVTSPIAPPLFTSMSGASVSTLNFSLSALTQHNGSPPPPTTPSSPYSKRKKLKAKRDRDRMSPKSRSCSSSPRNSICDVEAGPSSQVGGSSNIGTNNGVLSSANKTEDMLWFHRALTMSQIFRYLVYGDIQGAAATNDAISDAYQSLLTPTVTNRLLVITGIPTSQTVESVKKSIHTALRGVGGLFKDEIFVPLLDYEVLDKEIISQFEDPGSLKKEKNIRGCAVIEIKCQAKLDLARRAIFKCKALLGGDTVDPNNEDVIEVPEVLSVSPVNQSLQLGDSDENAALESYLRSKLMLSLNSADLSDNALIALTEIFHSCFIAEQNLSLNTSKQKSGFICLSKEQITNQTPGNLLYSFFSNVKIPKKLLHEHVAIVLMHYGLAKVEDKEECLFKSKNNWSEPENILTIEFADKEQCTDSVSAVEKYLTLDGFIQYVCDKAQQDVKAIWQGLLVCGYDFHFDRCSCIDVNQAQQMSKQWTLKMDYALCNYINSICRHLAITPSRLHPHEVYISAAKLASPEYSCLQGAPAESICLRFALLQSLNNSLETFFLPLVDLRVVHSFPHSTAALLSKARNLIFYDTKITLMNRVLNATIQRKPDMPAPEIILDPLEIIGNENRDVTNTQFCQAMRQLSEVSSNQLCVQLASGGDPTYAFNVRPTGEEVHGTSGSFRHFLSQISKELEGPLLHLLMPSPSTAANNGKGRFILWPGSMTYSEEKLLQFFGQLLGITLRADIPLPLNLLPSFWKSLVDVPLNPVTDLQEMDLLTYNYIKQFSMIEDYDDFMQLIENYNQPCFVYSSVLGDEVELCLQGRDVHVCWENHHFYIKWIQELRMKELSSKERFVAIKTGLSSVIPYQLLWLMTPLDLELRTCGIPEIDFEFLKAHTMYQVGLTETDPHIEFFWNTLESLSQDELCKFIKFACNQDRIPSTCPCRDGQSDTAHVPPYPMKIAPPDGKPGSPDSRYIRVETCMFMIKLPQYSTQEIMTERLLYAIHCRDDPLSG